MMINIYRKIYHFICNKLHARRCVSYCMKKERNGATSCGKKKKQLITISFLFDIYIGIDSEMHDVQLLSCGVKDNLILSNFINFVELFFLENLLNVSPKNN